LTAPAQIPLDLPHRPAMGAADFLVASCNRDAVAWLDRWPDWPATALVIHGDEGCGKSHLTHVWQALHRRCRPRFRGRSLAASL
jgi:chromosomal replication initiation ATPase DnaA